MYYLNENCLLWTSSHIVEWLNINLLFSSIPYLCNIDFFYTFPLILRSAVDSKQFAIKRRAGARQSETAIIKYYAYFICVIQMWYVL